MSDHVVSGTLDEVLPRLGDDSTAMGMAVFLHQLCLDLTERGWDIPPMLYSIERVLPDPQDAAALARDHMQAMMLGVTPIEYRWGDGLDGWAQAQLMHHIARGLRANNRHAAKAMGDRDVLGWAYVTEGWTLPPDQVQRYYDADPATRGPIAAQPDRIEYRVLMAADRAGYRYLVHQQRGDQQPGVTVDWGEHRDDGEPPDGVSGNIADAVADLAAALPVPEPD